MDMTSNSSLEVCVVPGDSISQTKKEKSQILAILNQDYWPSFTMRSHQQKVCGNSKLSLPATSCSAGAYLSSSFCRLCFLKNKHAKSKISKLKFVLHPIESFSSWQAHCNNVELGRSEPRKERLHGTIDHLNVQAHLEPRASYWRLA